MKIKSILGLSAVALALTTGDAKPRRGHIFQLSGVTFGGPGGTATGTFTTDDAITSLLDYDITDLDRWPASRASSTPPRPLHS